MARGKTLNQLIEMVQAEANASTVASHNIYARDRIAVMLRRTQEFFWQERDWDFLRVRRDIALQAGQRYYDFPSDLDFTRINETMAKWDGLWRPVKYGIGEEQFNVHDSDVDERHDPIERWVHDQDAPHGERFEVWPIPASDNVQTIRFIGIRKLRDLVDDDDIADMDDLLLVLNVAAEILSQFKSPLAQKKLADANARFNRLVSDNTKTKIFQMGMNTVDPNINERIRVLYARAE